MRTPVQSRSESSADRMLAATLDLLEAGGLPAVTVAAVARAAGTSNGSLYHRFGDREGLLVAAQQRALAEIRAETDAAFAAADGERDDESAMLLLSRAALEIFRRHRGAMRAFVVGSAQVEAFEEATRAYSHLLAETVVSWLVERFGAPQEAAEAAWRVLFALGASRALFDDAQVSPTGIDEDDLARAVARALAAVVAPVRSHR